MRRSSVSRRTSETEVTVGLTLEGGAVKAATGVPFFDHMLDAFGRHGLFGLEVSARGDVEVDAHHTVEDAGICLGQALAKTLGDKTGIRRFGSAVVPMDEALVLAAVDVSGRGQLHYDIGLPVEVIGSFDTTLAREFLIAFATNGGITLHVRRFAGDNAHHVVEAAFKATARALAQAVEVDERVKGIPSTKGSL